MDCSTPKVISGRGNWCLKCLNQGVRFGVQWVYMT